MEESTMNKIFGVLLLVILLTVISCGSSGPSKKVFNPRTIHGTEVLQIQRVPSIPIQLTVSGLELGEGFQCFLKRNGEKIVIESNTQSNIILLLENEHQYTVQCTGVR